MEETLNNIGYSCLIVIIITLTIFLILTLVRVCYDVVAEYVKEYRKNIKIPSTPIEDLQASIRSMDTIISKDIRYVSDNLDHLRNRIIKLEEAGAEREKTVKRSRRKS